MQFFTMKQQHNVKEIITDVLKTNLQILLEDSENSLITSLLWSVTAKILIFSSLFRNRENI